MRIKLFSSLMALPLLAAAFVASAQTSPVGRWKTMDDETGKPMTITEVYTAQNGTLAAKIVENLGLPGTTCNTCSGKNKGKPYLGMVTLWGLKSNKGVWGGGQGYKPSKDTNFKVKSIELVDGGKKLKVTGCKAAFLCRSAEWVRVN